MELFWDTLVAVSSVFDFTAGELFVFTASAYEYLGEFSASRGSWQLRQLFGTWDGTLFSPCCIDAIGPFNWKFGRSPRWKFAPFCEYVIGWFDLKFGQSPRWKFAPFCDDAIGWFDLKFGQSLRWNFSSHCEYVIGRFEYKFGQSSRCKFPPYCDDAIGRFDGQSPRWEFSPNCEDAVGWLDWAFGQSQRWKFSPNCEDAVGWLDWAFGQSQRWKFSPNCEDAVGWLDWEFGQSQRWKFSPNCEDAVGWLDWEFGQLLRIFNSTYDVDAAACFFGVDEKLGPGISTNWVRLSFADTNGAGNDEAGILNCCIITRVGSVSEFSADRVRFSFADTNGAGNDEAGIGTIGAGSDEADTLSRSIISRARSALDLTSTTSRLWLGIARAITGLANGRPKVTLARVVGSVNTSPRRARFDRCVLPRPYVHAMYSCLVFFFARFFVKEAAILTRSGSRGSRFAPLCAFWSVDRTHTRKHWL
ncbi:hypothetical protein U1Q18_047762 [Sarracenia purpurea var. burkii]